MKQININQIENGYQFRFTEYDDANKPPKHDMFFCVENVPSRDSIKLLLEHIEKLLRPNENGKP